MTTTDQQRDPGDPESALAQALAGELRIVIGRLSRRLREEANLADLTWPQLKVISRLDREGPATVTALARAEGVRPQSMGETVALLRSAGLVRGAPDPNDGRRTVLSLTAACLEVLRASRAAREDWLHRVLRTRLVPAEREELAAGIELLKRLVDS
jgi:DNA-binding MarR family transcriptional regulator